MKIGIVSDTHRNSAGLATVVDWLIDRQKITGLYHLGDDYDDVRGLESLDITIVQVPGVYHPGYRDGSLPAKIKETLVGLRVLLVHALEKDFTDEDRSTSDIILHGHTHQPGFRVEDGLLFMNPGHLKAKADKTIEPTFGLLDVRDTAVKATILGMDYEVVESLDLTRSENGLYRI